MYSLNDREKGIVKDFLNRYDLKHFIEKNDWNGFWATVDDIQNTINMDDSYSLADEYDFSTFIALMITSCHLAGIDCKLKAIKDCNSAMESTLCIPNGVEEIYEGAFANNTNLIEVYISPSVKDISDTAFAYCRGIKEITLSKNWAPLLDEKLKAGESLFGIHPSILRTAKFNWI